MQIFIDEISRIDSETLEAIINDLDTHGIASVRVGIDVKDEVAVACISRIEREEMIIELIKEIPLHMPEPIPNYPTNTRKRRSGQKVDPWKHKR